MNPDMLTHLSKRSREAPPRGEVFESGLEGEVFAFARKMYLERENDGRHWISAAFPAAPVDKERAAEIERRRVLLLEIEGINARLFEIGFSGKSEPGEEERLEARLRELKA